MTALAKEHAITPYDTFKLIFTDEILAEVVKFTNESIKDVWLSVSPEVLKKKKHSFRQTDQIEIKALFGLFFIRGSKHDNLSQAQRMFSHHSFPDHYAATMSAKRFKFRIGNLRFDLTSLQGRQDGKMTNMLRCEMCSRWSTTGT